MKLSERIRRMGYQNPAGQIVTEAKEYNVILLQSQEEDRRLDQLEAENERLSKREKAMSGLLIEIYDMIELHIPKYDAPKEGR